MKLFTAIRRHPKTYSGKVDYQVSYKISALDSAWGHFT